MCKFSHISLRHETVLYNYAKSLPSHTTLYLISIHACIKKLNFIRELSEAIDFPPFARTDRGRVATVNHGAQGIKAFISKSSRGNSVAASSVLMFRITPFIN